MTKITKLKLYGLFLRIPGVEVNKEVSSHKYVRLLFNSLSRYN